MSNTIFLNTLFPALKIGSPPEMSWKELAFFLKLNLSKEDYTKLEELRRPIDIENIRLFWRKEQLDPRGNYSAIELEQALASREGLPSYIAEYLERFTDDAVRLKHFPLLLHEFYRIQIPASKGFIKRYLQMERDTRLIFAAYRAKQLGRNISEELQYEDPEDPLVASILAQKDSSSFDPPEPYEGLRAIFQSRYSSPFGLHQAVEEWRFNRISELTQSDSFSLDWTLAYLAQLEIVERWLELDKKKGLKTIDLLVRDF